MRNISFLTFTSSNYCIRATKISMRGNGKISKRTDQGTCTNLSKPAHNVMARIRPSKLNGYWPVRAIATIQSARIRHDEAARVMRAIKPTVRLSASSSRRRDDANEDNQAGNPRRNSSQRPLNRKRRMRSVKPNCLRDKSSVSSIARLASLRLARPRTHLRACASLALSSAAIYSLVIRNYVGRTNRFSSLSLSLLFCPSFGVIQNFRSPTRMINISSQRGSSREKHISWSNRKNSSKTVTSFDIARNKFLDCLSSTLLVEMRDVLRSVFRVKAAYEES